MEGKAMSTQRLEAFTDGVIAIVITIMVLEIKVPHSASPEALLATIYHQLGIDPNTMLYDEQKRPIPILPGEPKPIAELLG